MGGKVTQFSRILPRTPVKIVVEPGCLAAEAVRVPEILEAVTGFPASRLRKTGRLTVFPPSPTAPPGQQWPHFPHLHVATRRRLHPYGATATFSFPGVWKKPMTSPFFMYVRLVGQTRRRAILPVFPLDYREKHWLTAQFFVTLPRFSGKLTPY